MTPISALIVSTRGVKQVRRHRRSGVGIYLCLIAIVAVALPPVVWIALTAFKSAGAAIASPPQWFPDPMQFGNFGAILGSKAGRFFFNSAIIAIGSVFLALLIAVPAAYAGVRFRFRGRELIMTSLLVISMVPAIAVLIALYAMFVNSSLINTYPLLIFVYTGMITGQAVWFIRNFIEQVPREIEEAAMVDGCSRLKVIRLIVLPLILPGLAAVAIFVFIFVWNDFLVGTILTTTEEMRTVQVGLVQYVTTENGRFWHLFAAYVTLAFMPVLTMFVVCQRWFIAGLTAGGMKG